MSKTDEHRVSNPTECPKAGSDHLTCYPTETGRATSCHVLQTRDGASSRPPPRPPGAVGRTLAGGRNTLPSDLRDNILGSVPSLRAFAISLTGDADRADDLVQEAIVRGLGLYRLLPTRHEHAGVAFHDPTQPVSHRISKAKA